MAAHKLTVRLNSGREMPMIGLGTFQIRGKDLIYKVIDAGLKAGYRAIDTAAVYGNEEHIGAALKVLLPQYRLTREDVFITTKLPPSDHGRERAPQAVRRSLLNLQTSYIDLYLIHWPGASGVPVHSADNARVRDTTWHALVDMRHRGLLRDIGVSNYTYKHLSELINNSHGVLPAVNQVECHPHYKQSSQLRLLCQQHGIVLQAYSSLGGTSQHALLQDSDVCDIASSLGKSPAQVLLRWAIEQGIAVIPKSVTPERIAENINLNFTLPKSAMDRLNSLPHVEKYAWNPELVA